MTSLAEEYRRARAVIEPVQAGTGIKVKVVDALCHGRPVVTTRAGAAGLDRGLEHGVVVAGDAGEFTTALRALFTDERAWTQSVEGAASRHGVASRPTLRLRRWRHISCREEPRCFNCPQGAVAPRGAANPLPRSRTQSSTTVLPAALVGSSRTARAGEPSYQPSSGTR